MKAAPLRLGGQGLRTNHDDHLVIIGDAAGHIDPLTGEGIHTAILGGRAAAETVLAMRKTGDFSKRSTAQYNRKVQKLFAHDFGASVLMAQAVYRRASRVAAGRERTVPVATSADRLRLSLQVPHPDGRGGFGDAAPG